MENCHWFVVNNDNGCCSLPQVTPHASTCHMSTTTHEAIALCAFVLLFQLIYPLYIADVVAVVNKAAWHSPLSLYCHGQWVATLGSCFGKQHNDEPVNHHHHAYGQTIQSFLMLSGLFWKTHWLIQCLPFGIVQFLLNSSMYTYLPKMGGCIAGKSMEFIWKRFEISKIETERCKPYI